MMFLSSFLKTQIEEYTSKWAYRYRGYITWLVLDPLLFVMSLLVLVFDDIECVRLAVSGEELVEGLFWWFLRFVIAYSSVTSLPDGRLEYLICFLTGFSCGHLLDNRKVPVVDLTRFAVWLEVHGQPVDVVGHVDFGVAFVVVRVGRQLDYVHVTVSWVWLAALAGEPLPVVRGGLDPRHADVAEDVVGWPLPRGLHSNWQQLGFRVVWECGTGCQTEDRQK